jgi:hypothetical protein
MVMVKGLCMFGLCYGMERALQDLMAEKPAIPHRFGTIPFLISLSLYTTERLRVELWSEICVLVLS